MNTSSALGSPRCPLLSRVSLVAVWEMRGKGAREGGKREGEKGHSGGLSHLVPAQRWGGSRYRLSTGRSKRGRCREEEEEEEEEGVVLFSIARMCIEAWSTGVWWTLQCTLYFCAACMTYDELCHVSLTALCFPLTVFQPQGSEAWEPVARWEEQHQDSRLRHGLPSGWRQSAGNQLWVSCTEEHHDAAFWFDVWGKRLRIKWKQVTGGGQVELPGCHREESGGAVENDEWSYQVLCKVPCSQSLPYRWVLISWRGTVGVSHRVCYLAVSGGQGHGHTLPLPVSSYLTPGFMTGQSRPRRAHQSHNDCNEFVCGESHFQSLPRMVVHILGVFLFNPGVRWTVQGHICQ